MSNNELPNLSAWHRVPAGAVIPKGTPYAYTYNGGITVDLHGCPRDTTMGQGFVAAAGTVNHDGTSRTAENPDSPAGPAACNLTS